MSESLAWTEAVSEDVEEALPPKMRQVLRALRRLHQEEERE